MREKKLQFIFQVFNSRIELIRKRQNIGNEITILHLMSKCHAGLCVGQFPQCHRWTLQGKSPFGTSLLAVGNWVNPISIQSTYHIKLYLHWLHSQNFTVLQLKTRNENLNKNKIPVIFFFSPPVVPILFRMFEYLIKSKQWQICIGMSMT